MHASTGAREFQVILQAPNPITNDEQPFMQQFRWESCQAMSHLHAGEEGDVGVLAEHALAHGTEAVVCNAVNAAGASLQLENAQPHQLTRLLGP